LTNSNIYYIKKLIALWQGNLREFLKSIWKSSFPDKYEIYLKNIIGETNGDILKLKPKSYTNKILADSIESIITSIKNKDSVTLCVKINEYEERGKVFVVKALYKCEHPIEIVYFRESTFRWFQKKFQNGWVTLHGRGDIRYGTISFCHPTCTEYDPRNHLTVEAFYGDKIPARSIHSLLQSALSEVSSVPEWIPEHIMDTRQWPSWKEAITQLHMPVTEYHAKQALERLAFDEVLAMCLSVEMSRRVSVKQGQEHKGNGVLVRKFFELLSFKLTKCQRSALEDIYRDLASTNKMFRLLQGDVGSGKTVVAFGTLLMVVEAEGQGAFLVPTDILARQHYETCLPWCQALNIKLDLLTGKTPRSEAKKIKERLESGDTNIVIGTHAILEDSVKFEKLMVAVIDEQHRFGVDQRLNLLKKGLWTDVLLMSATPIPRTLMFATCGGSQISSLKEKPPFQKEIKTFVMHKNKINDLETKIQNEINSGNKVYWVCPRISNNSKEDPEGQDDSCVSSDIFSNFELKSQTPDLEKKLPSLMNAEDRADILEKRFPGQVAVLHGKMKGKDKETVMESFAYGHINILVSTTVIEVGINIPEATIMIIEHSERFGLAQLHQLRGRVGRGENESQCFLVYDYPLSEISKQRLSIMKESSDGFYISEMDLKLRGGGEIFDKQQSGFIEWYFWNQSQSEIMDMASSLAENIIEARKFNKYIDLMTFFNRDEIIRYTECP
jgi:ATP-dependent DNA helicase RecG